MLDIFKKHFDKEDILSASFGIEREGLRVSEEGKLAITSHSEVFGNKLLNPYITTDFSESQPELITPVFQTTKEAYSFINALYDILVSEIGDEYIWPQSMPCDIPEDEHIPIARYEDCALCQSARLYREELFKKYGGKKQLISGIHFNFSFGDDLIRKLYACENPSMDYKEFKNNLYLKVVRNYLRYRWLLIYLLGAAPVIHESYNRECTKLLDQVHEGAYSNEGAISHRNGECGYKNNVDLFPDYSSVTSYIRSIENFVKDNMLQSHKELYTQIRPKAKNNTELLNSIKEEGIQYIEIRSIDINPFEKGGMSLLDMDFIHLLMLYCLIKEESSYKNWQEDALLNQRIIAKHGLHNVLLLKDGKDVTKEAWGLEILEEMKEMSMEMNLGKEDIIDRMIEKIIDPEKTYAAQLTRMVAQEGYLKAHMTLAKKYKNISYNQRYKLEGYEDMELSTQILMKEAIKRGIRVDILDRRDQFIALTRNGRTEYVKQATKTSRDSYITMLMMENKTVTKKMLEKAGICVPKGIEVTVSDNKESVCNKYKNKALVVKPKSTNFGQGVSIFKEAASKEDLLKALDIAFQYDDTVLIEEFARGKEYRFLVIGDQTVGILHRVPANVTGDGKHSIRELVAIKNQDSLRGKGYKTPLEKIELDESSKLFLKQQGLDFDYVPKISETVYLRENSNISTGGDSIDYTDLIPDRFKEIAVKAAQAVGARFCGVDMMLEDYQDENSNYAIIEINFNPAIHIHCYPYQGKERNIAEYVLKELQLI